MEALTKQTSLQEIAINAPVILEENKNRIQRAIDRGNQLLAIVQEKGMSQELDKQINDYLVKSSATLKHIKDARTPITQMLQAISKEFTSIEQDLDPNRDTVHARLQKCRNDWAKELAEEARKKEAERQLKINQNQERTLLGANTQEHVKRKFADHVFQEKEGLRTIFDDITLEEWDDTIATINGYQPSIDKATYHSWIYNYRPLHISLEETKKIIADVMAEMLNPLTADLQKEIADFKHSLSTEYQAKKNELQALKDADESERKQLEKEANERKKNQQQELFEQKKALEEKARIEADSQKQQQEIENLFDQAEVEANKPKRTGYSISLTHPKGWMPVMSFWFEKEGVDMPIDEASRVTLDRMLRFCEKHAHKNDEKIESPYLKYSEEFKAKAK